MLGDAVLGVFPQSHLSWWLYHVLLLIGFLIAIVFLWRAYEQIRAFRLSRYYAAASLIVTAALALLSAHVYSQQVYRDLLTQLESNTAAVSQNIAIELAAELPEVQTVEDVRRLSNLGQVPEMVRERLAGLQVQSVFLYDADGVAVFSTEEAWMGTRATTPPEEFAATLDQGETTFELHAPGAPPRAYQPASPVFILQTYVPFRPGGDAQAAPIGVLVTIREAPVLSQSLTDSRRAGLGLAALSLGGLFVALLAIVRRADQIITTRTRELEHAYADLRQAESMRDDLTYMIVHDLRNPLAAITTNLDLITRTIHDPKFADAPPRFLNSARGAGQRMMGMIDDLLNVSKYEAGELRPVLAPLYLPTFLAEKAEGYRMQADREQKSLSAHVSPDLPMVMADAGLIGRVVDNLVSNAFKYTSQGGHIEISTACTPDTVLVHVRDDGQGIPREYHQRIFEKFVQVTDGTGAPLRKGTGLGLALCRIAVEAHHGRIWVESAPGQGSTFTFTLPASPPEDGAPG
jgi:signal transduction histidine kinase